MEAWKNQPAVFRMEEHVKWPDVLRMEKNVMVLSSDALPSPPTAGTSGTGTPLGSTGTFLVGGGGTKPHKSKGFTTLISMSKYNPPFLYRSATQQISALKSPWGLALKRRSIQGSFSLMTPRQSSSESNATSSHVEGRKPPTSATRRAGLPSQPPFSSDVIS